MENHRGGGSSHTTEVLHGKKQKTSPAAPAAAADLPFLGAPSLGSLSTVCPHRLAGCAIAAKHSPRAFHSQSGSSPIETARILKPRNCNSFAHFSAHAVAIRCFYPRCHGEKYRPRTAIFFFFRAVWL
jgi:hypothetical protein